MRNAVLLGCALALASVGCGAGDEGSGLSKDQEQVANDLSAWAKKSDGDFNKLSPSEQQALVKSTGTEEAAKQVLKYKAHPPTPIAGGPPAGWKPGGPPPSAGEGGPPK